MIPTRPDHRSQPDGGADHDGRRCRCGAGKVRVNPSAHQMNHHFLRQELLSAVRTAVESKRGEGGIGSVACRASAALDALLGDHLIDRRGQCRSCRGSRGLLPRRRRVCRVLVAARYYLHQPQEVLLAHLANELTHGRTALRSVEDPLDPCSALRRHRSIRMRPTCWRESPAVAPLTPPAVPSGQDGLPTTTAGPG